MAKRVFLLILDSFGIGEAPDADLFGDKGSNTLGACTLSEEFAMHSMRNLGLFNIDGIPSMYNPKLRPVSTPSGAYGRLQEASCGKDTTVGHWEIAGLISQEKFPTFPNGFPDHILQAFEKACGKGVLCNKPYSGTAVIKDYGQQHLDTGKLIVYTSADSVFQIAAHQDLVPVEELYEICEMAREVLVGEYGVARVIARPFVGDYPNFQRTANRHDFSLPPTGATMLDFLDKAQKDIISIGKIHDIFAGRSTGRVIRTQGNADGIAKTLQVMDEDFEGLCFVNLVDFDMLYGHRNDCDGYAKALRYFDEMLPSMLIGLREDDLLMISADHGCDPYTPSTDHSREYVPWVIAGHKVAAGVNLGTIPSFGAIAATICDYLDVEANMCGYSCLPQILGYDKD